MVYTKKDNFFRAVAEKITMKVILPNLSVTNILNKPQKANQALRSKTC